VYCYDRRRKTPEHKSNAVAGGSVFVKKRKRLPGRKGIKGCDGRKKLREKDTAHWSESAFQQNRRSKKKGAGRRPKKGVLHASNTLMKGHAIKEEGKGVR